jgi:hypothetical protein
LTDSGTGAENITIAIWYAGSANTGSKVTIKLSPAGNHPQAHAETAVLRTVSGAKSAVNYRQSNALDESARVKL